MLCNDCRDKKVPNSALCGECRQTISEERRWQYGPAIQQKLDAQDQMKK